MDCELNNYDLIAAEWSAARQGFRPGEQFFFEKFTDLLPKGARVLDLGCGTGIPNARFLTEAGYQVHGIDASAELLTIARREVPGAAFEQSCFDAFKIPPGFDGALSWDAMFHLPRAEQTSLINRLAESLPQGCPFLFTTGGSAQDPFTDTMWGESFAYDAHPPDKLSEVLTDAGFQITDPALLEQPTGGRNKGRLAVLAIRC